MTVNSVPAVAELPMPEVDQSQAPPFIEHHITAQLHPLLHWIEDPVGLSPFCIADEDAELAVVIQLS